MAQRQRRTFSASKATRKERKVYFGVFGAGGSGKTFSALRIAKGVQEIVGGKVVVIDTENGRASDYADLFDFEVIDMQPPFGSLDYLDAFNAALGMGASIVVIDSMSHEHEGEGGMLDFHEAECDRMAGDEWRKREAIKMLAWQKPKRARNALRSAIARSPVHLVLCFRAKETAKPVTKDGKTEVVAMGYTPIAGPEFLFEMTASALLYPASNGFPTWKSDARGERIMLKMPEFFRGKLDDGKQLSEEHGRMLARWARGDAMTGARGAAKATASGDDSNLTAGSGRSPDESRNLGGGPEGPGKVPPAAAGDSLHAEAVAAVKDALRGKTLGQIKALLEAAGIGRDRFTGDDGRVSIERLTVDELTLVIDEAAP